MGKLPQEFEDGFEFLRDAVGKLADEAEPKPKGDAVQSELGFPVDPAQPVDVELVRGNYDVSRLEAKNKKLVSAITFMLGLHFLPHDVIAKACNVSWETVAAVASQRSESIREFKGRMARWLGFLMEAMTPALLQKIKLGRVSFLDLKLLHEVWAPLAGEATSVREERHTLPALDQFMQTVQQMGLEKGKSLPEGAPDFGGVREIEAREIEPEYLELGDANNSASLTIKPQSVEPQ